MRYSLLGKQPSLSRLATIFIFAAQKSNVGEGPSNFSTFQITDVKDSLVTLTDRDKIVVMKNSYSNPKKVSGHNKNIEKNLVF